MPPEPDFRHLLGMTDELGTFEHACFDQARPEHGYCTDDMARVLVVLSREPRPSPELRLLTERCLRFLSEAQGLAGGYRNRMSSAGRFVDSPSVEDCWGRSIWALGTAASQSDLEWVRQTATAQLERAASRRSPASRAMAFAAIGAAELLSVQAGHRAARDLLIDAAAGMDRLADTSAWPWPEARLRYANAALPEAMIAVGHALERHHLLERGLELLRWLLDRELASGHLSVTPVGGRGPGEPVVGFDQQPIEVAALADACVRAAAVDGDGDGRWSDGVAAAVAWFLGDNDAGVIMWDPATGGGYDVLHIDGANLNQGTESTLALLSTLQHARHLAPV